MKLKLTITSFLLASSVVFALNHPLKVKQTPMPKSRIKQIMMELRNKGIFKVNSQSPIKVAVKPAKVDKPKARIKVKSSPGFTRKPLTPKVISSIRPTIAKTPLVKTKKSNSRIAKAMKDYWSRWQKAPVGKSVVAVVAKVEKPVFTPENNKVIFHFSQKYHPDGSVAKEVSHGFLLSSHEKFHHDVKNDSSRPDAGWLKREQEKEFVIKEIKNPNSPELRSSYQTGNMSANINLFQ